MPEPTAPAANFWQPGFWAAGFWAELFWGEEDTTPPEQPAGGGTSLGVPFRWVPFAPVAPKRPRKKRQTEVLFLG